MPTPLKYRNKKVKTDEGTFDSKKEYARWGVLRLLQRIKEIEELTRQPEFPLMVNTTNICVYKADFSYIITKTGKLIVEDVKGVKTPVYNIKKKLMKAIYNIEIKET